MNLCLEALTAADAEPYQLVEIAAANDIREISVFTAPVGGGLHDIVGDTHARRETKSRCDALGVRIALVEGFLLHPVMTDREIDALIPRLESAAWLGARSVNVLSYEQTEQKTGQQGMSLQAQEERLLDRFHYFCDRAENAGLLVLTELSKRMTLKTVP